MMRRLALMMGWRWAEGQGGSVRCCCRRSSIGASPSPHTATAATAACHRPAGSSVSARPSCASLTSCCAAGRPSSRKGRPTAEGLVLAAFWWHGTERHRQLCHCEQLQLGVLQRWDGEAPAINAAALRHGPPLCPSRPPLTASPPHLPLSPPYRLSTLHNCRTSSLPSLESAI